VPKTRTQLPRLGALLIFFTALSMPAAAGAHKLPPGVHVDPGSPAAKEYSIPLATARGAPAGSSSSGQLFGAGITKGGGSGSKGSGSKGSGSKGSGSQGSGSKGSGSGSKASGSKGSGSKASGSTGAEQKPPTTTTQSAVKSPTGSSPATHPITTPAPTTGAAVQTVATVTAPPTTTSPARVPPKPHRRPHARATHRAAAGTHTKARSRFHDWISTTPGVPSIGGAPAAGTASAVPSPIKVLHPSSGSGLLWMLLVAAAVLVLGGGAGIAVSRSRRRAPGPRFN